MTSTTGSQPPTCHPAAMPRATIRHRRRPARTTVPRGPDNLVLSLKPRQRRAEEGAVTLELSGDLDLAGAPRFLAAMAWLREHYRRIIVVDTRRLQFVDLAGYRAFTASLDRPDGRRDPRVLYVVGDVLARLRRHLALASGAGPPRLS